MSRSKSRSVKGSTGLNRKNTQQYLEKYRCKPDVFNTESGVLYRILESANGLSPTIDDEVQINQRAWLVDGTVIEDTYKKGEIEQFRINSAIEGLQEGLQLMNVGARFEFVIPPELAWGRKGVGKKIGPNAALTFDIRLINIIS